MYVGTPTKSGVIVAFKQHCIHSTVTQCLEVSKVNEKLYTVTPPGGHAIYLSLLWVCGSSTIQS